MLPLIGKAIVRTAFYKMFRARKGAGWRSSPGLMHRKDFPHRVFPQAKDRLPRTGKVIGMLFPAEPPPAILLNGESGGNKAIAA
jgi:hypothetical protein